MAISGWYSPEAVIIRENRWTPPPDIHIMKARKPTPLAVPVARAVMAACFRAREGVGGWEGREPPVRAAADEVEGVAGCA